MAGLGDLLGGYGSDEDEDMEEGKYIAGEPMNLTGKGPLLPRRCWSIQLLQTSLRVCKMLCMRLSRQLHVAHGLVTCNAS